MRPDPTFRSLQQWRNKYLPTTDEQVQLQAPQRFPVNAEGGNLLALQQQVESLRQELHDLKEELRKKDQEREADEARWTASLARLTSTAPMMTEAEAEALLTEDVLRILQTPLEDE
jgi:hypothetical protein